MKIALLIGATGLVGLHLLLGRGSSLSTKCSTKPNVTRALEEAEVDERELESGVLCEEIGSAEEFMTAIAPANGRWGIDPTRWIYRGQANADWKLRATIATAYRCRTNPT